MITAAFLAVLACTIALGGWLIARIKPDLPFQRLSARRDPAAADTGPRAEPPLGARATSEPPAPAEEPAQLSPTPDAGFNK
jgi:hypothetical protein